jgi:DNA replication protein DnaC
MPQRYQKEIGLNAPTIDLPAYKKLNGFKMNIVDHVKSGQGMLIYSEQTGNGKTTWATKIMNEYFKQIALGNGLKCRGVFVNTTQLFLDLKDTFDVEDEEVEEMHQNLFNADLVIWDDIGISKLSEWEHGQLYRYLNYRNANNKSNIFTTNVLLDELSKNVGKRLVSRIYESSNGFILELHGTDYRLGGH